MPDDITINIQYVKPRPGESICRWNESPETLLAKLVQHLVVPADKINKKSFFVYSPAQPGAEDQSKIWIKTSAPYGIGFFAGGLWNVAYSIPPGLISIQSTGQDLPPGYRALTDQEIEAIGLEPLKLGRYVVSK